MNGNTPDWANVQVFGKVAASVSHDLKNVLAIINENAGLLDDFSLRAAKGIPIPPERLRTIIAGITKQVKRGDAVLSNLSNYAHSTDNPMKRVQVGELVVMMVALAGRQAAMKEITLTLKPAQVAVTTQAVLLESLFYLLLQQVLATVPAGAELTITVAADAEAVMINFTGVADMVLLGPEGAGPAAEGLVRELGAELTHIPGWVRLRIPEEVAD